MMVSCWSSCFSLESIMSCKWRNGAISNEQHAHNKKNDSHHDKYIVAHFRCFVPQIGRKWMIVCVCVFLPTLNIHSIMINTNLALSSNLALSTIHFILNELCAKLLNGMQTSYKQRHRKAIHICSLYTGAIDFVNTHTHTNAHAQTRLNIGLFTLKKYGWEDCQNVKLV